MEVLVKDIIVEGEQALKHCNIDDWKTDRLLLAEYFLGVTRKQLLLNQGLTVDVKLKRGYMDAIQSRCHHIPLQYLTGTQEFMGLEFEVNTDVLIPRQDTEVLVEAVLTYIDKIPGEKEVLDLCTGSGCIAVSIDKMCGSAKVTACDISEKALETAVRNNQKNKAAVTFIRSDLFEQISGKFDVIVSNPPYIRTDEIPKLMPEVKNHEPVIALDGDADGLKFYRMIVGNAREFLKPEGMLFFEIGCEQGEDVQSIFIQNGFSNVTVQKDLAGNDRVIYAKLERK